MDDRTVQFRIGLMVLGVLLITGILLLVLGEGPELFTEKKTIQIELPTAPGVSEGTPIRKSGVHVGRVTQVKLLGDGGVLVTAEIDAELPVLRYEVCRVNESLLGDAELNFVPTGPKPTTIELIQNGDTVRGVVAPDPMQVVASLEESLAEVIHSVTKTSSDTSQVMQQIGRMLNENEEQINSIVDKADSTLDVVQETVANANALVGDPELKGELREAVDQVPDILEQAQATLRNVDQTFSTIDKNMKNLEGFTQPLGERGPFVVARLEQTTEKLDLLMDEILMFSKALNSSNGTVGRMMHDRELYDNLNRVVTNLDTLSSDLRPIINDARIFSDKIARHPELLGVRGAMQKNPGTKGIPILDRIR